MGRTNPTFRNVLEAVKSRWGDYRRALRRRDQAPFDRLFEYADAHADAAGYLDNDDPMEPILVSMLLGQEKRIADLDGRISDLDGRTAELEARTDGLEDRIAELDGRTAELEARIAGLEDRVADPPAGADEPGAPAGEGAATTTDGGDA